MTTLPATPTARTPAPAELKTANPPAGRAAPGRTQPDDPANVTPYSDPLLPATQPATATERHTYTPSRRSQANRKQMDANARANGHRYAQRRQTQARSCQSAQPTRAAQPQPKPNHESRNPSHTP